MRAEGTSVRRIAVLLGVAKSSVSVWVRDVERPAPELQPVDPVRDLPSLAPTSGARKTCSRCHRSLPVEAFNRLGRRHQAYCRECFRAYFRERGEVHRAQVRSGRSHRVGRARAAVLELLAGRSCQDCGIVDIRVLEFDHLGLKRATLADLVRSGASARRLAEEAAECDVVCVNCHRQRTARRAGWFRATGRPGSLWSAAQRRNQAHVLAVLRASCCCDCGEADPVVLEFDHRGEKRGDVSTMATWASLATLREEIAKCDIRCANCHRRRTYASLGSYRIAAVESNGPP